MNSRKMPHTFLRTARRGFTLVDLLAVMLVIAVLLALLIPATRSTREPARRNLCSNHMRQLVLGVLNHENATSRFPGAMIGAKAANTMTSRSPWYHADDDGYGYLVQILAYVEEAELADQISELSEQFTRSPNTSAFRLRDTEPYVIERPVDLVICPSFPGENLDQGDWKPLTSPQVSNYHALAAGCVDGATQVIGDQDPRTGGMIVTKEASSAGLTIDDCTDGISKTAIFCESRREQYSAWFSGVATVDVALPPDTVQCSQVLSNRSDGFPTTKPDIPSGLNYGIRVDATPNERKHATEYWRARDFHWGPSSGHAGNVVMHGYADGHVKALNPGIDATTYFRLVSRGGGEPADDGS